MNNEDFLNDPAIQAIALRYTAAGKSPDYFTSILDAGIEKATAGIKNPVYNAIAKDVIYHLLDKLKESEAKRVPKTRVGKWLHWLSSLL